MNRFKNLHIWKRAVALASDIYRITSKFPEEEKFGIISQLRRCAVSIGSNIAEGAGRGSPKEFQYFLCIAYGSSYELETQLIISENLNFIDKSKTKRLHNDLTELQKMIYSFNKALEK